MLTLLAIAAWGCTPARYRESADEETYRIIKQKQEEVFGEIQSGFSIEKQPLPEFMRGPEHGSEAQPDSAEQPTSVELTDEKIELLTDQELIALLALSYEEIAERIIATPPDAVKLTLAQALELAVANSRKFQAKKESFFLQALALTYQRHLWRPQLGLTGSVTGSKEGEETSGGAKANFSVGQAVASGAKIALNLGTTLAEFFTGDRRRAVGSLLSLTFSQPLLRGGGRLIAMESLTQAERNVIYQVRDFARYRKQFSVQAATAYYGVLQQRDTVINFFKNYISTRSETNRIQTMFDEKYKNITLLDVDEARQDELKGKNAWISARQAYMDRLDQFKIDPLGLPTETLIALDEKELQVLTEKAEAGLLPPEFTVEEAVEQGLTNRLDLITAENAFEDSERAVAIARDALRAGLDVSFSTSADTEPPTKALKFRFNDSPYSGGLAFDLPVDRKQERNSYRQALIALESQKRSLSLLRDTVKLEVRQSYRNLEEARKSCDIQKMSVDLATRRVDNARESLKAQRATARDVLFARRSLVDAQNALTSALVQYELAKLQLWISTEELQVDERGLWVERNPTERGDGNVEPTERAESEKEKLPKS